MDTAAKTTLLRRAAAALREDDALHQRLPTELADWLTAEADAHDGADETAEAVTGLVATVGLELTNVSISISMLDYAVKVARSVLDEEAR
jgi:hypothetical protein